MKDPINRRSIPGYSVALVIIPFLTGCMVYINNDGYGYLNEAEKQHFQPFPAEISLTSGYDTTALIIYRLCEQDIQKILKSYDYTWVHIWAPYCPSADHAGLLNKLQLAATTAGQRLNVVLISSSYDYDAIKSRVSYSRYPFPVYVLDEACFGSSRGKALRHLHRVLHHHQVSGKRGFFGDYLLKDTTVVKEAWHLSVNEVDSLISAH